MIGVWNSSKQTLHDMIPVLRVRSLENSKYLSYMHRGAFLHLVRLFCIYLHFDIAGFLMVTKRAGELDVQVARHLFLWRWLSL